MAYLGWVHLGFSGFCLFFGSLSSVCFLLFIGGSQCILLTQKKKNKCEQVFTLTNYYYYLSLYKRQVVLFQPPCSIKLPFSCTFRSFSFGIVIPFVCVVSNHIINLKSFNFRSVWFKLFQIAFNKLLLTKVMKSQVNCSQAYLSIERFVIVTWTIFSWEKKFIRKLCLY